MWIVAKIKIQEINIFKKKLIEKFGKEINFYSPKITYSKYSKNKFKKFDKFILENYIFCFHKNFNDIGIINRIQFIRGVQYILNGHKQNQNEITHEMLRRKKHIFEPQSQPLADAQNTGEAK